MGTNEISSLKVSSQTCKFIEVKDLFNDYYNELSSALVDMYGDVQAQEIMDSQASIFDEVEKFNNNCILDSIDDDLSRKQETNK